MPEKTLNETPRELRPLYTKGCEALTRENFDYAIDLFCQVLAREPGVVEIRKALRRAQSAKAGSGGGFFKKMMNTAGSSPGVAKAQLALLKNPAEAIAAAESVLNTDPNSAGAHKVIVEASLKLEMPQTAALSLDILVRNNPKDKALAIQYAEALADTGDVKRAEKVLIDLLRLTPNDGDLASAVKNISARRTLSEGGYEKVAGGQGSYRDILKNEKEAVELEQEKRVQKSDDNTANLIAEYETRLTTEPANFKLIRSLAELYTQKKQFAQALALYDRLKSSDVGNDASLDSAIAATKVKQFDHEIGNLDPTAPEHAERAAQLNAEKVAFQVAECQKRVDKYPTDMAIRFEMGVLYFQAGKIGEAIAEFQKARNNPHKRLAAMNYLAQSYAKRKMNDLAAKTLQEAIKEKLVFDDEKKDLTYNLGSVLESMGKKEEAIEQFKLIYEMDSGYKDVGPRVEAYYAGQ